MEYLVEYMVVIENKSKFCATPADFYKYLSIQEGVSYKDNHFDYQNKLRIPASLISGQTENKQERFFQIAFKFTSNNNDDLNLFLDFLREIRGLLHNLGEFFILHDDISRHYGSLSYPLIHETENLMRKLINAFMIKKLGSKWSDSAFPPQLSNIANKDREGTVLHKLDFDHLRVFLFKEYSIKSPDHIYKIIKSTKKPKIWI